MSDKIETVAAIMHEFKAAVEAVGPGESVNEDWLIGIPGRVLAAHRHEIEKCAVGKRTRPDMHIFDDNYATVVRLEDENEKMREALKPILAFNLSMEKSPCKHCWGLNDNCIESETCERYVIFKAVCAVQKIIQGGAE